LRLLLLLLLLLLLNELMQTSNGRGMLNQISLA